MFGGGSSGGGPFLPLTGGTVTGPVTFGTGTSSSSPGAFQALYNVNPAALPGNLRQSMFNTNLTYSATSPNIWENLNSFVYVNGPGTASGEINAMHAYIQVNPGGNAAVSECFEASTTNNGVIGQHTQYLGLINNGASATATYYNGVNLYLNNLNTTPGAIGEWSGISFPGMTGGGSRPTFYNAIRVADANLGIVTLGGVSIGDLAGASPGRLSLRGADTSGGTFPFIYSTSAGNVVYFANNATVNFPMAGITIQPGSVGAPLTINGKDNSAGTFPFVARNLAGMLLLSLGNSGEVGTGGFFSVAGNKVIGARSTGWGAMSGVSDKATAFATSTVTLAQLAGRVMALQDALTIHGVIGA